MKTVGDYISKLQEFPLDWPVCVSTQAGGGIAIEHREIKGNPVIAIFGANGGRFGENPLTEQEYEDRSKEFMQMWNDPMCGYSSVHGDHRMYYRTSGRGSHDDTCYGKHFNPRIIERMVEEGLIPADKVDIERVRRCNT